MPANNPEHAVFMALSKQNLLTEKQLGQHADEASYTNTSLIEYLISQKIISSTLIAQALSHYFDIPYIDLKTTEIDTNTLPSTGNNTLIHHAVLPIKTVDGVLFVALSDPNHLHFLDDIATKANINVEPNFTEHEHLLRLINNKNNNSTFSQFKSTAPKSDDSSISELTTQILNNALICNASDIHIEPQKELVRIRQRVDGILTMVTEIHLCYSATLVNHIKILAKLDIAEKRKPLDGHFKPSNLINCSKECRLSTCPTLYGEKMVIRLLDSNKKTFKINQIGMSPQNIQCFQEHINKPQGLILVSGPTGSGKTLTLYTALSLLNTLEKNIVAIEDPVEIHLKGINQANINPKAGFTFSTALRAFLRQDPDIIMIGEIRDNETAKMAIRAALTGHLVLSTLHANSAAESIIRLINMGVEPINISAALSLVIAQRLVRTVCSYCQKPANCTSRSCHFCTNGYAGRTGVYEMLPIGDKIKQLILDQASSSTIEASTQQQSLMDSAINKVKDGITTFDEINRVI